MAKKSPAKTAPLKPADFVHLHLHSHYSLLDGLSKIPQMLDRVKELGMDAAALTDHGTMSGAIEFYQECKARELKPVIGIEAYLARRGRADKDADADRRFTHLIILAQNNQGYENLMKLSTVSYLEGFYYKPRIDKELLVEYGEGLIILSGCMGGEIGEFIQANNYDKAKEVAGWYKQHFGDRFYLEIQDHGHANPVQQRINEEVLKLAEELGIEPVLTADSHYLTHADQEAHEILLSIQTKRFFDDEQRMSLKDYDLSLTDPAEIIKRWQDVCPQAVLNSRKIADRCEVEIEFDRLLLPTFKAEGEPFDYLNQLVFEGLAVRYGGLGEEEAAKLTTAQIRRKLEKGILERADYELETIKRMDFSSYFLIVWDFCRWGKEQKIFFGPGRGSAAGSIVSYSLNITNIDPIKYDLLFERFLNPARISMPDIDIDIEDSRRDEVIHYVTEKYGEDRVANIVTFGKMAARNAVRDVARVLRMSFAEADQLAKMLPLPIQGRHIPLETSLKEDEALQAKYRSNAEVKRVFDLAVQLEGTIRSHGVHAAGVVIAPDPIVKYTPLEVASKGAVTTQYAMNPIEDLGLLKMDFLGLSNLTTIKNAMRIIRKIYDAEIDIENLPLDDAPTYELLTKADTTGVFQLESRGMRQHLQRLEPNNFEDISAMVALYRPGPLSAGLTDQFIERRHGRQKVEVAHPSFEPALSNTYGVLVYQEQVMQISRDICGFSGAEADELRKAIGKKKRDMMAKMKDKFIDGGVESGGVPRNIMERFWQDIVGFADYAFNRAHSVSYGLIAYQTAYLKTHYRSAFMAAVMTSDAGNTDRLKGEILECNLAGIDVLPPDVNESFPEFAVILGDDKRGQGKIRFGLEAVKNVSNKAVDTLVEIRNEGGPYKDLADFVKRQKDNPHLNRKTVESLVKAGAFDCFLERETLLANLDKLMQALSWAGKQASSKQASLLDLAGEDETTLSDFGFSASDVLAVSLTEKLDWERELLGVYISQHPLDVYGAALNGSEFSSVGDLDEDLETVAEGQKRKVGGIITSLRQVVAKVSRRKMAIIEVEDKSGAMELIVSPDLFERHPDCWAEGSVLSLILQAHFKDYRGNQLPRPNWSIEGVRKLKVDQNV
ncbi:DNA polymerase III subunit alpha [Candidatus Saccharibacteria bacterium]|nr:DNA polymerase III subunit alpha [Candidatus Saccharibacteria bacterium]